MLHQKILDDLKNAMKIGDSFRVGTLRMVLAAFHNKEIEKKGRGLEPILSEEEIIEVLSKEAKKRKEAIEIYKTGQREDLVQKERQELEIIEKYLPEQLTEEEIEKIVKTTIEKIGAQDIKDLGRLMGEVMKELRGRADASLVSKIAKSKLKVQN